MARVVIETNTSNKEMVSAISFRGSKKARKLITRALSDLSENGFEDTMGALLLSQILPIEMEFEDYSIEHKTDTRTIITYIATKSDIEAGLTKSLNIICGNESENDEEDSMYFPTNDMLSKEALEEAELERDLLEEDLIVDRKID